MPEDADRQRNALQRAQEMREHEREARTRAGEEPEGMPREEGRTPLGTPKGDPLPPSAAPLM